MDYRRRELLENDDRLLLDDERLGDELPQLDRLDEEVRVTDRPDENELPQLVRGRLVVVVVVVTELRWNCGRCESGTRPGPVPAVE